MVVLAQRSCRKNVFSFMKHFYWLKILLIDTWRLLKMIDRTVAKDTNRSGNAVSLTIGATWEFRIYRRTGEYMRRKRRGIGR
jgi:hypothetical protein